MKILFLGYDNTQTALINFLQDDGCVVTHIGNMTQDNTYLKHMMCTHDITISFGYRYIIPQSLLQQATCKSINLHISYLPFNKGAHPNFWAFYDSTPHGVTIHEIAPVCDAGNIIIQEEYHDFHDDMLLSISYQLLMQRLESLLMQYWQDIKYQQYQSYQQIGQGSYHKIADLPIWHGGWDMSIQDIKQQLYSSS